MRRLSSTKRTFAILSTIVALNLCLLLQSLAADYKTIQTITAGKDVGSPVSWQVTGSQADELGSA
jgi:hypothetical protein